MMKRITVLVLLMGCFSAYAQKNEVYMIGPMFHVNFGGDKIRTSFALEISYWNYEHFPYSVDAGLEFEKKKIRLYSEAQTGIGVAGISTGPVLELLTGSAKLKAGWQGSVWGNYFLGFDLRFRRIDNTTFVAPGTYVKVPLGIFGGEYEGDGDDWDWDDWD